MCPARFCYRHAAWMFKRSLRSWSSTFYIVLTHKLYSLVFHAIEIRNRYESTVWILREPNISAWASPVTRKSAQCALTYSSAVVFGAFKKQSSVPTLTVATKYYNVLNNAVADLGLLLSCFLVWKFFIWKISAALKKLKCISDKQKIETFANEMWRGAVRRTALSKRDG